MRRSPELRPKLWDGLVVLAVILLAAVCAWAVWGGQGQGAELTAVVSVDGVEKERLSLKEADGAEWTISSNGYTLHVILTAESVWVEESDCPTQDCVHTGHISRGGQSIVCLPARVVIQLEGGTAADGGPDIVIG